MCTAAYSARTCSLHWLRQWCTCTTVGDVASRTSALGAELLYSASRVVDAFRGRVHHQLVWLPARHTHTHTHTHTNVHSHIHRHVYSCQCENKHALNNDLMDNAISDRGYLLLARAIKSIVNSAYTSVKINSCCNVCVVAITLDKKGDKHVYLLLQ